jgi:hypothetical protein
MIRENHVEIPFAVHGLSRSIASGNFSHALIG